MALFSFFAAPASEPDHDAPDTVIQSETTGTPESASPHLIYDPLVMEQPYVSEPRRSPDEKQPKKLGYPYQIYVPLAVLSKKCFSDTEALEFLKKAGVEIEKGKKPLWLHTNEVFAKITLKSNQHGVASRVHQFLSNHTERLYKNWI